MKKEIYLQCEGELPFALFFCCGAAPCGPPENENNE